MDIAYAITPFLAWFAAGTLKFIINSCRARRLAFGQIGYGGLPSNHSAIVSSTAALIAFREGMSHPAFGVAVTIAFVVMMDANSLRRHVGKQAEAINMLLHDEAQNKRVRERMGHTPAEIGAGLTIGIIVAWVIYEGLGR
ncbi:divergent PAP2 family protein [Methylococcus sp. Mc7]|uniref:divergent PAP2 family protein n=1 Tax=Methylococcus sp. Mc7 TaxID=2860258 RepID=UPI001C52C550|nr:divergent PAP2 family protein [Methylococcus sp. Mc7]QXP85926.1 divergent PAP2 family protein [Methylococcus sp. Mc7]